MTPQISLPQSTLFAILVVSAITVALGFCAYAYGRPSFEPLFVTAVALPDLVFVLLLRDLRIREREVPRLVCIFVGLGVSILCAGVG
jgi:hypothetical protein